jgi:hypothetical protein
MKLTTRLAQFALSKRLWLFNRVKHKIRHKDFSKKLVGSLNG